MIEIKKLDIIYNYKTIVKNIEIKISKGCITLISGKSGSGKTSLLQYLSLDQVNENEEYRIDGKLIDVKNQNTIMELKRNLFSYVFQDYELISNLSIYQNIQIAGSFTGHKINKQRVIELLNEVGLSDIDIHMKVSKLSGGQRQRVSLAMAIAKDTDYIILDEPTASLDHNNIEIVNKVIQRLKQAGKGIIIVSHNINDFDYDCLYRIEDNHLLLVKDYPNYNNTDTCQNNKDSLLLMIMKAKRLKLLLLIVIITVPITIAIKYLKQGEDLKTYYLEQINNSYNTEMLVYQYPTNQNQLFGIGRRLTAKQLTKIRNNVKVEKMYPYYMFIDIFTSIVPENCNPLVKGFNMIDEQGNVKYYTVNTDDSMNVYNNQVVAFNQEMTKFIIQDTKIKDGIYLSSHMANILNITDIKDKRIVLDVFIPVIYNLGNLYDDKDGELNSNLAYYVQERIELPISGIVDYDNTMIYETLINDINLFYMDYHLMEDYILTARNKYQKEIIEFKNKHIGSIYEDNIEPHGWIVVAKDIESCDSLIKDIKEISPLIAVKGVNEYNKDRIEVVNRDMNRQLFIAALLAIIVALLVLSLRMIQLSNRKQELSYYYVNGIDIKKLYAKEILFIQITSMFLTLLILGWSDIKVWIELFSVHVLIIVLSIYKGKNFLNSCDIEQLLNRN